MPEKKIFYARQADFSEVAGFLKVRPRIIVEDRRWRAFFPRLEQAVYQACRFAGKVDTVVFSTDREVKKLNFLHRHKNKSTNVLSFPAGTEQSGELILAFETVRREALQEKKLFSHHVRHLLVHGILHLAGFDHIFLQEALVMEKKEARLLKYLSVPNPRKNGRTE